MPSRINDVASITRRIWTTHRTYPRDRPPTYVTIRSVLENVPYIRGNLSYLCMQEIGGY